MSGSHDEEISSTGEVVAGPTDQGRPWSRRGAAIFLSLFTLGGLFFAILGARNTWEMSRQLSSARSTTGAIRSASVGTENSTDSNRRTTTHYVPHIAYSYEVAGVRFEADRIYPGAMLIRGAAEQSQSSADQLVGEYAPGTPVTVWYLPDEPGTAFLVRQRRVVNGLFCLVGGILAAAGAGLLLPQLVTAATPRFLCAAAGFLVGAQWLTSILWAGFVAAPRAELDASPRLLQWLLLAYVVICWTAMIANAPAPLRPLKLATFAGVGCGTISMSLSIFVLIPLMWFAPRLEPMSALPWIGVGMGALGVVLWACGLLTIGKPRPHGQPDEKAGATAVIKRNSSWSPRKQLPGRSLLE